MSGSSVFLSDEAKEPGKRVYFLGAPFDCVAQSTVVKLVNGCRSGVRFRYVVTPNVDHVVRLHDNSTLAPYYDQAWLSLCDSQPITRLAKVLSLDLPLVTGSDLTALLFNSVIQNGDRVTIIAANEEVVRGLERAYPTVYFSAFVPPNGVWSNAAALKSCVDFAISERARFIFIAIGSPQSEKIAHTLLTHPDAEGVGFCIGASLEFITGAKKRAPTWMRRSGFEWLHRLASDPRRLWRRYAFAVVPLMRLFIEEVARRQPLRVRG